MLIVFDPRSVYVNEAAQITLGNAQNRVQNELKYPCSGEEHQQRYTYVYWDSSNSSGQSSKSSSK